MSIDACKIIIIQAISYIIRVLIMVPIITSNPLMVN
jgi:hypothetical protein